MPHHHPPTTRAERTHHFVAAVLREPDHARGRARICLEHGAAKRIGVQVWSGSASSMSATTTHDDGERRMLAQPRFLLLAAALGAAGLIGGRTASLPDRTDPAAARAYGTNTTSAAATTPTRANRTAGAPTYHSTADDRKAVSITV